MQEPVKKKKMNSEKVFFLSNVLAVFFAIISMYLAIATNLITFNFNSGIASYLILLIFGIMIFLLWTVVIGFILSLHYQVLHFTYGRYTNDNYGISILLPNEWRDDTAKSIPNRELLVKAVDPNSGAAINLMAGPQLYGEHPTIEDIEGQARKHLKNIGATDHSIRKIRIGNMEAVETVYTALSMRTKKVALVQNGTEYIFTCSSDPNFYDLYEPAFNKSIHSFEMATSP